MSEFIFHNVGQGLFYSGHLSGGKYNFVYDCGTINKRKYLHDAIDKNSFEKEIDFVVISHLHKDHINGIKYLISKCNVKKFYLPYLGGENKNLIKFLVAFSLLQSKKKKIYEEEESFINEDDHNDLEESYLFFLNLYGLGIKSDTAENYPEIKFIGEDDGEKFADEGYVYSSKYVSLYIVEGSPFWKFVMFNRRQPDFVLNQLNNAIGGELKSLGYSDITQLVNGNKIDDITIIYENVFKNGKSDILNLTSTILVHFPIKKSNLCVQTINSQSINKLNHCNSIPTTILTGDAEFDDEMSKTLDSILIEEQKISTIFQVPHHGSRYNWHILPKNYKTGFDYYVILLDLEIAIDILVLL